MSRDTSLLGIEGREIRIHHEALLSLTRVGCALYVLAM